MLPDGPSPTGTETSSQETPLQQTRPAMSSPQNVKHVYKNMVRLCRQLPEKDRASSLQQVRAEFRKNKGESDPAAVQKLVQKAVSSLGYLRIVTPKKGGSGQVGTSRLVFDSERRFEGRRPMTNWNGSNMDPDCVQKHKAQLKRARFTSHADVYGNGGQF